MSVAPPQHSLLKLVDTTQCECRNEAEVNSLLSLFNKDTKQGEEALIASAEEDPQLFISLGFTVPVRLTGLRLGAPKGAQVAGEAPRRIRLFINDPTKSFGDAETDPAIDEFELPEDATIEAGVTLPLKSVRYKGVASLQVFIADNGGASVTKISALDVLGSPVDSLQMKDWKPLKPEEAIAVNDT